MEYIWSLRTGGISCDVMSTSWGTYGRIEQTSEAMRETYKICRAGVREDWNWEPLVYSIYRHIFHLWIICYRNGSFWIQEGFHRDIVSSIQLVVWFQNGGLCEMTYYILNRFFEITDMTEALSHVSLHHFTHLSKVQLISLQLFNDEKWLIAPLMNSQCQTQWTSLAVSWMRGVLWQQIYF